MTNEELIHNRYLGAALCITAGLVCGWFAITFSPWIAFSGVLFILAGVLCFGLAQQAKRFP